MLGTGTWHLKIGNMFYNGDITLRVFDDGGKYGFEIIEPKMTAPEVEIKRLSTCRRPSRRANCAAETPRLSSISPTPPSAEAQRFHSSAR